jgi:hypothetical protein
MFTRLAKFRLVQPWRIAPGPREAMFSKDMFSRDMHSNDNLPGFRRPKGRRRIPTPALACHWIYRNGRLECRWQAEPAGDAPIGDSDEHGAMGRASGRSSMQPRGRSLALAG